MSLATDGIDALARAIREPRRTTGKALQYWDALRGDRPFPRRDEVAFGALPEISPHLFVVSPGESDGPCRFVYTGSVLGALCGEDPTGRAVADTLPSELWGRAASLMATAFQVGKPLADSGIITLETGEEVLYRAVFMPLSEDQRRVDSLLGAVSFKRRRLH